MGTRKRKADPVTPVQDARHWGWSGRGMRSQDPEGPVSSAVREKSLETDMHARVCCAGYAASPKAEGAGVLWRAAG